jgi:hypothetical protein
MKTQTPSIEERTAIALELGMYGGVLFVIVVVILLISSFAGMLAK